MKILLTGASGLLGTDISITFANEGYELIKASRSPREGFLSADISTQEGIDTLSRLEWDAIIHTSASKDPDECERNKKSAYNLNVTASEKLANAAAIKQAKYFFISTDYVFSGTNPPYAEESPVCPVNYYGQTKAEAERKIFDSCKNACVLRVPLLYGINAGLQASALLYSSIKAINSKEEICVDDANIRYPTYTGDVARALLFLLKTDAFGIYHFSGQDKLTKYKIIKIIAECANKNSSHIKMLMTPPKSEALRPPDSRLDSSKIFKLGVQQPLSFTERIRKICASKDHTLRGI